MTTRKLVYMPLDDLEPALRQVKDHATKLLATSISRFGLIDIPTIDERTGRLVAGHGRRDDLLARRERGEEPPDGVRVVKGVWQVPVQRGWASADDAEAAAAGVAANQSTIAGGWYDAELAAMLSELAESEQGLEGLGFDRADLDALLRHVEFDARVGLKGDPDDVPPVPKVAVTAPGDLWVLGDHRLLCGDATDPECYAVVLDGDRADMVWTDPPYGVEYGAKNRFLQTIGPADRLEEDIEGDGTDPVALAALLKAAFGATRDATRPGAVWFVAAPAGPPLGVFTAELLALDVLRQGLCWMKNRPIFGRSDYHYQHETLFYGWTPGAAHQPPPTHSTTSVWAFDSPAASKLHPTMKPVALVGQAVGNHTDLGGLVLDPFAGSGTTMVAAQELGRRARLVEIDPAYCDVICARFQRLTGIVPSRDGQPHDFLAE